MFSTDFWNAWSYGNLVSEKNLKHSTYKSLVLCAYSYNLEIRLYN